MLKRVSIACCNFSICVLANILQWTIPNAVPGAWFDEDGRDMGVHELRLLSYMSFFVYLTAQVLVLDAFYYMFSLYAEWQWQIFEGVSRLTYKLGVWINGISIMTGFLFYFFFTVMVLFKPRWRDQWNYYESLGYAFEARMHVMHFPLLLCPVIDFLFVKRKTPLRRHSTSKFGLLLCSTVYVIVYASLSTLNYYVTSEWVYPWLYEFSTWKQHVLYYFSVSLALYSGILAVHWCVVGSENQKID